MKTGALIDTMFYGGILIYCLIGVLVMGMGMVAGR
jgi:hypothetical protein